MFCRGFRPPIDAGFRKEPFYVILQIGEDPLNAEKKQLVLIGVVVVYHSFRYSMLPADPLHADILIAERSEFVQRRTVDFFSAAFLPLFLHHSLFTPSE